MKKGQGDFLLILKELFQIMLVAGPILLPLLSYVTIMRDSENLQDILLSKQIRISLNSIASVDYPSEVYLNSEIGSRMIGIEPDSFFITPEGRYSKRINSKLYPTYDIQFEETSMYTTFSSLISFQRDQDIVGFQRFRSSNLRAFVPNINTYDSNWDEKNICFSRQNSELDRQYIDYELYYLTNSFENYGGCDFRSTFKHVERFGDCDKVIHFKYDDNSDYISFNYSSREMNKFFSLLFNEMVHDFEIYDFSMYADDKNLIKFNFNESNLLYEHLHKAFLGLYGEVDCTLRDNDGLK